MPSENHCPKPPPHLLFRHRLGRLLDGVQVVPDLTVHAEHGHLGLLEDRLELLVAYNLASVVWILQVVLLDVLPDFLDHMGTG